MSNFTQYTQAERLAQLEIKMTDVKVDVENIDSKLDHIIALRNRGEGVFWFLTAVGGSGVVAWIITLLDWIKMKH